MTHPSRSLLALLLPLSLLSCQSAPAPKPSHLADAPPLILYAAPLELPQPLQDDPPTKTAIFKVEVLPSGKPGDIKVSQSSGDPKVDALCAKALRQYKFRPATSAGKPITATTTINFNFANH